MAGNGRATQASRGRDVAVLVVAPDSSLRDKLVALLEPHCGRVSTAASCKEALKALGARALALLVVDISACGQESMRLLAATRSTSPLTRIVTIASPRDMRRAVEAVKLGVTDCLSKPLDAEHFLAVAKRAIDEVVEYAVRGVANAKYGRAANGKALIGQSEAIREVLEKVDMVKDVSSNVLIQGETGTGKELVAYAIHDSSPRADGPFVKLNCGAIPKDLLESELFGHEKGSFTGALQQRIGRFEMANGGTILLDEIGDMPLDLQVKLLGVVQDRVVQRVGGHERIPVDVRVVAATHQDLVKAISEKRFRQDLYFRLNVITIQIPPLRQHKDDIPLLIDYFLAHYCRETGRKVEGMSEEARSILLTYDYPGNVRELENIIESSVVLCPGNMITPKDLSRDLLSAGGGIGNEIVVRAGMTLDEVERLCVIETLRYTEGNKRRAAQLLGIGETTLYRKIEQYGIVVGMLVQQRA